jgi:hypothetical protein
MTHCFMCYAEKKLVNHWYLAYVERTSRFCIVPFDDDPAMQREEGVMPICGEFCLHRAIQRHLENIRSGLAIGAIL